MTLTYLCIKQLAIYSCDIKQFLQFAITQLKEACTLIDCLSIKDILWHIFLLTAVILEITCSECL